MTDFYVPGAEGIETTDEDLYESIVKALEESQGAKVSDDRIQGVRYRDPHPKHEKDEFDIEVGDIHPVTGDKVEAILFDESRGCYLICSPSRGVAGGVPILVGDDRVQDVEYFD